MDVLGKNLIINMLVKTVHNLLIYARILSQHFVALSTR